MSEAGDQRDVWTNGQWYSFETLWGTCANCGKRITMGEAAYGDARGRIPGALHVVTLGRQSLCGGCAEKTRGGREGAAHRAATAREGARENAGETPGAAGEEAAREGGATELLVDAFTAILFACAGVRVWVEFAKKTRRPAD